MYQHVFSDFNFVTFGDDEVAIQLLRAPYTGLIVQLGGEVGLRDVDGDGDKRLSFEYRLLSIPPGFDIKVLNGPEFTTVLGDIMLGIMERHFELGGTPDSNGHIEIHPEEIQPSPTNELAPVGVEHNHVTGDTTIIYS